MDLLKDKIKKIYFKYLTAAFGSAMISSIYGLVDMAVVGQYQGPDGTAALAVVAISFTVSACLWASAEALFSARYAVKTAVPKAKKTNILPLLL